MRSETFSRERLIASPQQQITKKRKERVIDMRTLTKWAAGLTGLGMLAGTALGQSAANNLEFQARQTITTAKQQYPSMDGYFRTAVGWAVFPTVTKGALIVGGSHGDGIVYQNGQPIGEASLSKASIGAQAGGENYSEVIFFQTPQTLSAFESGNYSLTAAAAAIAGTAGVGQALRYDNGAAVFTFGREGLIAQAAIGGQRFAYRPLPVPAPGSPAAVGGSSSPGGTSSGKNGTAP